MTHRQIHTTIHTQMHKHTHRHTSSVGVETAITGTCDSYGSYTHTHTHIKIKMLRTWAEMAGLTPVCVRGEVTESTEGAVVQSSYVHVCVCVYVCSWICGPVL